MQELTTAFEQHDMVWAKVQSYPWWPGKVIFLKISQIIEIFEQKKSLFFKISFYADPTYCYLKEDALIPFEDFREQLNKDYFIDSKLRKAIDLASDAFLRKKSIEIKKNTSLLNQDQINQSSSFCQYQMSQQIEDKQDEQFEQSTIHADFLLENQHKDDDFDKKTIKIQTLLEKYKLDQIPNLPKKPIQKQQIIQDQTDPISCESEQQDPNEDFEIKKVPRSKTLKTKAFTKPITKKKKVSPLTESEKKVKFMKRLCSLLIEKQIESSLSREITVQVINKFEVLKANYSTSSNQLLNSDEFFIKYFEFLNKIELSMTGEQKLVGVFNLIEIAFYQNSKGQKFEEEKTQITFAHSQMQEIS